MMHNSFNTISPPAHQIWQSVALSFNLWCSTYTTSVSFAGLGLKICNMHHTVRHVNSLLTGYSHVIMTSGLLKTLSFCNSMGYSVEKYYSSVKKSHSPNHTLKKCTQNVPYSQTQTPYEARIISPLPTLHARYYRYFYTYVLGMPWSTVVLVSSNEILI